MTDGLEPDWEIHDEVHHWDRKKLATVRDISKAFKVPEYLLIATTAKPSWWRHPIRRLRVWWWSR